MGEGLDGTARSAIREYCRHWLRARFTIQLTASSSGIGNPREAAHARANKCASMLRALAIALNSSSVKKLFSGDVARQAALPRLTGCSTLRARGHRAAFQSA